MDRAFNTGYKTSWFAPFELIKNQPGVSKAKRNCDGTPFTTDPQMGRFETLTPTSVVDWNFNGSADTASGQDINLDGATNSVLSRVQ